MMLSALPVGAADTEDTDLARRDRLFPRPTALEPQVRFWRAVFAEYSIHQVVLHDALYLDKIYKVLDFRPYLDDGLSEGEVERLQRVETDLEVSHLRATLLRLHALGDDQGAMTAEERRIYTLYRDDPAPDRFLAAADEKRLHTQRGLRERFAEGIRVSRRYLPDMERIFRDEGLPPQLTRLPLIESCFNLHANSKVGAAGIWQFMPATGRLFMRVDNLVDERRDPIHSTRAAAAFLRDTYDALGTWPLAITAYNHGPDGVARAVRETGTDAIDAIVKEYHGRAFGFASRNFYAEFLAALDVDRDYRQHFGDLHVEPPLRAAECRLQRPLAIQAAAKLARCDREELASLNPALAASVVNGRRPIPSGYRLRLPGDANGFESRLAMAAPEEKVTRVAAPVTHKARARVRPAVLRYRVRPGQTLSHIARRHGVSLAKLRSSNRLRHGTRLRIGQVLVIPNGRQTAM